jgi:hypothetical protein
MKHKDVQMNESPGPEGLLASLRRLLLGSAEVHRREEMKQILRGLCDNPDEVYRAVHQKLTEAGWIPPEAASEIEERLSHANDDEIESFDTPLYSELPRCPFCDHLPVVKRKRDREGLCTYFVECSSCSVKTEDYSVPKLAMLVWKRRPVNAVE